MSAWSPRLGAWCTPEGARFRVWAPERRRVEVVLETPGRSGKSLTLERSDDGTHAGTWRGVGGGDLYRYRLDRDGPFPDPVSRFQPQGVHGPSEIIDPSTFSWSDAAWRGTSLEGLVVYELHVGTFTRAGTFAAAIERLPRLRELGVTAIEIMPVGDFPGERNWGYDGVDLFAPARCYGRPDDLRRLVDAAHGHGLGVLLDVVYNHLGPDGAYLSAFSKQYFSANHHTPWGMAMNLDGPHADQVREFFIENARHWTNEYHFDGLRLDATHALVDDSPRHFLEELATRVRADFADRHILVIAEDHRNLASMLQPRSADGFGLDGVWADDFHHQVRRRLAGDSEGYFADFRGTAEDIAETVRKGWFFCGQTSEHLGEERGTDPTGIDPRHFVICLQNHDQIGNRAFGERLHHQIDLAAYRAAVALLLCAPETPLLFMGQEWAASAPFLFFTDHSEELGHKVTEGRRREFRSFSAFSDAKVRETIPDPQSAETFERSKLDWSEAEREPHASILRLHRALLELRRALPHLAKKGWDGFDARAIGGHGVILERALPDSVLLLAVQLRGASTQQVRPKAAASGWTWERVLDTEEARFAPDPAPIALEMSDDSVDLRFARPGAVLLVARPRPMP